MLIFVQKFTYSVNIVLNCAPIRPTSDVSHHTQAFEINFPNTMKYKKLDSRHINLTLQRTTKNSWSRAGFELASSSSFMQGSEIELRISTVNRNEMVRLGGKLQRLREMMSETTLYFCHVINKRYQAA